MSKSEEFEKNLELPKFIEENQRFFGQRDGKMELTDEKGLQEELSLSEEEIEVVRSKFQSGVSPDEVEAGWGYPQNVPEVDWDKKKGWGYPQNLPHMPAYPVRGEESEEDETTK
jgi:hypothetical protein